MRKKDLRELRRRLEEVDHIFHQGYDPVNAYGETLWLKRHWGSLHTHRGALRDIEEDRRPVRNR